MGHSSLGWLGVLVVLGIVAVVVKILTQKGKGSPDYPYQKEPTLFTPAERSFLGVLEQVVGSEFRIMGKVRLADVIRVKPGLDGAARQKAFNRIQGKHLDFVACDPNDLSVQFAVELDDRSHERGDRQERDAFLDAAMDKVGIPIIRFAVKKGYSIDEIRQMLASRLNPPETAPTSAQEVDSEPTGAASPALQPKRCPSCGADMVRRKTSKGQNAGQEFWGCSSYPKCRSIVKI